jgi:prophage maintenance system killer protein
MQKETNNQPSGEILLYQTEDGRTRLEARMTGETVWLTQKQMADLFQKDIRTISEHVRNVYEEGELFTEPTLRNFRIVQTEGKRQVERDVAHYNLDVIISVGYRVKSQRGTQFRIWATRTLRDHLVQGYTFNQTRLAERGLLEARQTLELLARTLQNQALVDDTGRAVLELITGYADTWRLLLEYDEDRLASPPGARPSKGVLDYAKASTAIADFKRELMTRNEATALFGNPRGEALDGILASIEQTMFGEALYRSREEKAANLLYLVIKDHPFSDGNKRIGSFLFMLYLRQEDIAHSLNPSALTALALLIAESAPASKDLMIRLTMNLLVERAHA